MNVFERFTNNQFLSPISSKTLKKIGRYCGLNDKSEVLEVDCGKGGVSLVLAHLFHSQITGTENRSIFLEDAKRHALFEDLIHKVNFIESDIKNLPFDEKFFDLTLYLSPPIPCEINKFLVNIAPFTVDHGWIAISKIILKDKINFNRKENFKTWVESFKENDELRTLDESIKFFEELGFSVKENFLEDNKSWDDFYSSQALTLLEKKSENSISIQEKKSFDKWKKELEMYHSGGGKESLEYVTFLMQKHLKTSY
ncbi:MAG: class I SAM-dependent methyltransferase [Nitrospinota bacterium]|nr:class I SAM-dependent methyltransferase [Nitrospinota bacterium]